MLQFWKKAKIIDQKVVGINQRNAALVYRFNNRKDYKLADDKVLTKTILHRNQIACADTYAVVERIGDIPAVWEKLQQYDKLAIKPAQGLGGNGIKILKRNNSGNWMSSGKEIDDQSIFQHMANILMGIYSLGGKDWVLIEYCIEPHPFFAEMKGVGR